MSHMRGVGLNNFEEVWDWEKWSQIGGSEGPLDSPLDGLEGPLDSPLDGLLDGSEGPRVCWTVAGWIWV